MTNIKNYSNQFRSKKIIISTKQNSENIITKYIFKFIETNGSVKVSHILKYIICSRKLVVNTFQYLLIKGEIIKLDKYTYTTKAELKKKYGIQGQKKVEPIFIKKQEKNNIKIYSNLSFEDYLKQSMIDRENRIKKLNEKIFNNK